MKTACTIRLSKSRWYFFNFIQKLDVNFENILFAWFFTWSFKSFQFGFDWYKLVKSPIDEWKINVFCCIICPNHVNFLISQIQSESYRSEKIDELGQTTSGYCAWRLTWTLRSEMLPCWSVQCAPGRKVWSFCLFHLTLIETMNKSCLRAAEIFSFS